MPEPARPLALSATSFCSRASQTIANMSPPMPVMCGSVTLSTAAAVTAASTALPPRRRASSPASAASGWLVATTPCAAYTVERPARVVGRWPRSAAGAPASMASHPATTISLMRCIRAPSAPGRP
jgi:hypothetical protein